MQEYYRNNAVVRRPQDQKQPLDRKIVGACSILSGLMLAFAMPNIVGGSGLVMMVKAALLAISTMIISYGVNRLAVERGAPLAVIGYKWAAAISIASIVFVGSGMFAATYSGLVYLDVEQLSLEAYGQELNTYVAAHAEAAAGASRIAPAMNSIATDLSSKLDCEIKSSCVSGKKNGGTGPVSNSIGLVLGRASAIVTQIVRGEEGRIESLRRTNTLLGQYDSTVAADIDLKTKRTALQTIDLQIKQAVADLDEAVPVTLLRAYANELNSTSDHPGLTSILRGHAASLDGIIGELPQNAGDVPAFPKTVGVTDTFFHFGHFLPVAAIAGVTELVFPLCLWFYTYFTLNWALTGRTGPRGPRPEHEEEIALRSLLPHLAAFAEKPDAKGPTSNSLYTAASEYPAATSANTRRPGRPRLNGHAAPDET